MLHHATSLSLDKREVHRSPSALAYVFFIPGLLLAGGAFVLQLSGANLTVAPDAEGGSLFSQMVLGSFYLAGLLVFLASGKAAKMLVSAWPILIVPALAVVSALWSDDPSLTLRRAFALTGTVIFGLSFASTFSFRQCIGLIIRVLAIAMFLSVVWVVLFPLHGVHQAFDAVQSIHAGSWRGIFAHRNTLGEWGSITLALLLVYGQYAFESLIVRLIGIALAIACLIGAGSGTGYVLSVTLPLVAIALLFIGMQPNRMRLLLVFILAIVLLVLYAFSDAIFELVIWSTGRSPDLTGRTVIWHYVTQLIDSNALLGRGYYSGFVTVDKIITAVVNDSFGSAHNGYLEILVYFGYIGLSMAILVLAWLTWRGMIQILTGPAERAVINSFPMCVVVFVLIYNTVESGLMTPNSLPTLLLATVAGMFAQTDLIENRRANNSYRKSAIHR